MKKYIIFAILIVSSVAKAGDFYLKGAVGMNHIPKSKFQDKTASNNIKLKHTFPVVGLGIGYNFDNSIRIETIFDYYFLFTQLEKAKIDNYTYNVNLETKISDLMLNVIKEIKLSESSNIFIGGGVGVSSIKDTGSGYGQIQDIEYQLLQPSNGKNVYRFAYKVTTGIDYQLKEGIKAEIAYNFYNLGKNNPQRIDNVDNIQKRSFLIHNITLGLRFTL